MNKKQSEWFRGLLYAEAQIEKSIHNVRILISNAGSAQYFDTYSDFDRGVEDYIEHHNRLTRIRLDMAKNRGM